MKRLINKTPETIHQGGNLTFFREKRGWSQEYVAQKSGYSQQQISEIERKEELSQDVIKRLAPFYGIDEAWITEVDMLEDQSTKFYDQHENDQVFNDNVSFTNDTKQLEVILQKSNEDKKNTLEIIETSHAREINTLKQSYEDRIEELKQVIIKNK